MRAIVWILGWCFLLAYCAVNGLPGTSGKPIFEAIFLGGLVYAIILDVIKK